MIIGTGCDILEIERIERLATGHGSERVFTDDERQQASGRISMLAGDFSVKEAVSKCFGTGISGFALTDIEVLRDELGKPYVLLHGGAETLAEKLLIKKIHVSISDTSTLVFATAVAEG